jgi:hypothetical protein
MFCFACRVWFMPAEGEASGSTMPPQAYRWCPGCRNRGVLSGSMATRALALIERCSKGAGRVKR